MPTSPDDIVLLLSRWLARHLDNTELRERLADADRDGLQADQAEVVDELLGDLAHVGPHERGTVERSVREALEALATG
jgi:hypothetical protein